MTHLKTPAGTILVALLVIVFATAGSLSANVAVQVVDFSLAVACALIATYLQGGLAVVIHRFLDLMRRPPNDPIL